MSIGDLLFVVVFLAGIVASLWAAILAVRGRFRKSLAILRRLAICAALYVGIVILVSLVSPRRVIDVGDTLCWDDWCLTVADAKCSESPAGIRYVITFRVSSRARRRAQRGLGACVYLLDDRGRRYDPLPDPTAVPLDTLIQPQESVDAVRTFDLPTDAREPVAVMSHGSGFPGWFVIGDSASLFHKGTVVKLP